MINRYAHSIPRGLFLVPLALIALIPVASAGDVTVVPLLDHPLKGGSGTVLRIHGARNGVFSGKVVAPLGTKVSAPTLNGPGKLPASAIQVLYQHPDGPGRYHKSRPMFNGLHPEPPGPMKASKYYKPYTIQPIWLIVRVPADAKPGRYTGKWDVAGTGIKVELDVADFVIPNPADFATHAGFIQSPDSVAMQYGVEMWSEKHWKLMERSFKHLGELGTQSLYIPLVRRTHFGNPHSMVYWIEKENGYDHDFSIVEKYVALAVKHLGKIPVVCLYAWELNAPDARSFPAHLKGAERHKDREILISVKDANGALKEAKGPAWGTPECQAFWKPVIDGVRKILAKHNIADSMMIGLAGDYVPSPKAVKDFSVAAPNVKWAAHAHGLPLKVSDVPTGLVASVWGIHGPRDPAAPCKWSYQRPRHYGWQKEMRLVAYPRYGCFYGNVVGPFGPQPLAMNRSLAEMAMVSQGHPTKSPGCRGFDRLGADFWRVLKGKHISLTISGRYPECTWGQLKIANATAAILAPGKDGAQPTARFQMVREGLQETEARVFIEKALVGKQINGDMGTRIQKILDERVQGFVTASKNKGRAWKEWAKGDWQSKSGALYAAAAEVAKKVGGK